MKTSSLIGVAFSIGTIVNMHSSASTASSSITSSVSTSSDSNSELTFTGNSGRHKVNEDVVEVKNGVLEVNGISYGRVSDEAVIKYTVHGNKKAVYINGELRKPAR